ncbi:NADH-ubiquinone oxidoreductase-F iron-sulfur binding region domain-containing protein [Polynucleobacter necessarius]|uniref:NADH-ubiquinone oxidoreductase-F iron-sulfur binding region domain-containing protein n=1 Tax=Polynucleobacter necessarius TaxID=576610 RepID=UPI001559FEDA|nr:NADH-ubiquinone oxidoreductase-F iron-sulfur binding region domain-containing protein [Polynucleobacter necessarius]
MNHPKPSGEIKAVAVATADDLRETIRRKSKLKGRQVDDASLAEVRQLIGDAPHRRGLLIENLHKLNDEYRALHDRHLVALAKEMNLPMAEMYEVATFYHHFEVVRGNDPVADITVRVCDGIACELAGAQNLLAKLPAILGNPNVKVIAAPCVGRCEQAPVAVVHQYPVLFATTDKVQAAVKNKLTTQPMAKDNASFEPAVLAEKGVSPQGGNQALSPDYVGYESYRAQGGYALAKEIHEGKKDAESIIKAMENSGLRGLGGAGFPAGRKWRIVKDQAAPKLMAVNIDEGEPGTFKDRTYLERDPHRFLEGLLIAANVVGIDACYIYLRDEYHGCRELLEKELAKIGRPTLEYNFETLYWVRDIVQRGPEWFSSFGRHDRKGLRSFSVSGRVKQPGVKLAPAGITIQELIDEYCGGMQDGHKFYGYLPGGASGGILPATMNSIPLDFDTLQPYGCFIGSAAVMVFSDKDKARDMALNVMHFFEHESCGQCTPCRVGTGKAAQLMQAKSWDQETLEDLATVMVDASICGLGQAAPNPIRCIHKYFPQEVA